MSDVIVSQAQMWADGLLGAFHRGPGDTVESAMHRAARRAGIPYSALFALRYRKPRDVMASVYFRLQAAYEDECQRQAARLRHEIDLTKRVMGDAAPKDLVDAAEALVGEED